MTQKIHSSLNFIPNEDCVRDSLECLDPFCWSAYSILPREYLNLVRRLVHTVNPPSMLRKSNVASADSLKQILAARQISKEWFVSAFQFL